MICKSLASRIFVFAAAPLLVAMDTTEYRFHRHIEVEPGWAALEVPDDVFESARPGLPDVRIVSERGAEIPYVAGALPTVARTLPLLNVEQKPKQETTALVDRGADPGWADRAELNVTEDQFIKPFVLEASSDRASWNEIARGSIFGAGSTRMTKIRFAPSDRRYLRVHFDDKNGPPIHALGWAELQSAQEPPRRVVPATFKEEPGEELSISTYTVTLPRANLPVVAINVHAADAAFARRARVFERIWFRDEVSRRLLGEAEITRSADGRERTSIPIVDPAGKSLEIDIERTGGVALQLSSLDAVVESRSLYFNVPADSSLDLFYGAAAARAPTYDIGDAFDSGRPKSFIKAKLAEPIDTGSRPAAVAQVARGSVIDVATWKSQQTIVLPEGAEVVYLDLDRGSGTLNDLRIIDHEKRQVPYLIEAKPRHARRPVTFRAEHAAGQTTLRLDGLDHAQQLAGFEIDVTSPEYFSRSVVVVEEMTDDRGKAGERLLGTAQVVRAADQRPAPVRVSVDSPLSPRVVIRIADGDNAPLGVTGVTADVTRRRLNFVVAPGDRLTLLADNAKASAPHYDLALVAERVLGSPAQAATLGEVTKSAPAHQEVPPWFWVFVLGAALILMVAVGRAFRGDAAKPGAAPSSRGD